MYITLTPTLARRLAVTCQRLAGPRPDSIIEVMQAIRCLQIDPIRAVDYTQHLVLWSRLGNYDPAGLYKYLWDDRSLFEYWAHAASIVLTEDYPIFQAHMRRKASGEWRPKSRQWLEENKHLREHILARLIEDGPLFSKAINELDDSEELDSRWFNRNVPIMLDALLAEGSVMIAGRNGRVRLWDLAERCLPDWTPKDELDDREASKQGIEHALRALGVARERQIKVHFIRNQYSDLRQVIKELVESGRVETAQIKEGGEAGGDTWYIHADVLPTLEALQNGAWQPRTTLLSPFDNLICDRDRTEQLFNFHYRIEIYVPKAKRQYGYYVLPILHGDQLVGRISPKMDRKTNTLNIDGIFAEPGMDTQVPGHDVQFAINELATFLGANEIVYPEVRDIPAGWQPEIGR